ncbi:hypothetical protein GUJ93_ZPchr0012g19645 [Zizania palustris]|uniref:Uncharacterized protein n=1 Tax=Zizania palustris TaxID=103762 RepID=A0A8J6BVA4_ZIZPA|nr:hypothetical protein GUJ93_ZPchr0012g19645 [Zizania palustris]
MLVFIDGAMAMSSPLVMSSPKGPPTSDEGVEAKDKAPIIIRDDSEVGGEACSKEASKGSRISLPYLQTFE